MLRKSLAQCHAGAPQERAVTPRSLRSWLVLGPGSALRSGVAWCREGSRLVYPETPPCGWRTGRQRVEVPGAKAQTRRLPARALDPTARGGPRPGGHAEAGRPRFPLPGLTCSRGHGSAPPWLTWLTCGGLGAGQHCWGASGPPGRHAAGRHWPTAPGGAVRACSGPGASPTSDGHRSPGWDHSTGHRSLSRPLAQLPLQRDGLEA